MSVGPSHARARLRRGLAIALVAFSTACAEPPSAHAPRTAGPWAFVGTSGARELRVAQSIALPSAPEDWEIEGMQARAVQGGKFLRLRSAERPAQTRIGITGAFDPRSFNRIVVRASSASDVQVSAVFSENGEFRATTTKRVLIPGRKPGARAAPDVAQLQLQAEPGGAGAYTRMVLLFHGPTAVLDIHSVDLVLEPLLRELPAPDAPALVDIEGESRRAVGLSNDASLELTLEPQVDRELRIACAVPRALRAPGAPPVLELALTGNNGHAELLTIELDNARSSRFEWLDVRTPLAGFGGERLRVEARLRVNADGLARVCALTEPELAPLRETGSSGSVRQARGAPTVLLITSDTHRADHVRAAGLGVDLQTPALDALAQRGVYFENCFATTNVTVPSHVAIMTSVNSRSSGVVDNTSRLSLDATTLAELFRAAGWATYASLSVRTMGVPELAIGQGFERLSAPTEPTRRAGETVARLESWLADAEGQPLFVWVHVFDAHAPYEPPRAFDRMYYPKERDPFDEALPDPGLPRGILLPWIEGLRDLEFPSAQYRAEISYVDSELGRLLEVPRFEDAIIAMTADHGETLGTNNVYWDHAELYPSNLHVPLILAWPAGARGVRVRKAVFNSSIGRTLLDLAGLEDVDFGGESLLASLDEDYPEDQPRFVLSANASSASLTYGGWHLILHLRRHWHGITQALEPVPKHALELFHLASDPLCLDERSERDLERARAMRERLIDWLCSPRETTWDAGASQDAQLHEELAQLGYVTSTPEQGSAALFDRDCTCANCRRFE